MSLYELEVLKLDEVHGADLGHIIRHSYELADDYVNALALMHLHIDGFPTW